MKTTPGMGPSVGVVSSVRNLKGFDMNKLSGLFAAAGLGIVSMGNAFAVVDVSAVTTEIGTAAAPIAAIGAASLIVAVGIKVYKWVRRAL